MAISTDVYTFEWLRNHRPEELVELWRELEAPTLDEMFGEYWGAFTAENAVMHAGIRKQRGPGEWLGKGFAPAPVAGYPGQGYNIWFDGQRVIRTMRFAGEIGPSLVDGKPALMGYYRSFVSHNQDNGMTNEVRRVKEGLFVGIITTAIDHEYWGPVDPKTGRGKPHPFVLRGPSVSWQGVDDEDVDALVQR